MPNKKCSNLKPFSLIGFTVAIIINELLKLVSAA